jgi:hypothetical protein
MSGEFAGLGHVSSLAVENSGPRLNPRGKRLRIQGKPERVRRQQNISTYSINFAVYIGECWGAGGRVRAGGSIVKEY